MVYFAKWKIGLILAICLTGILYAAPNLLDRQEMETWSRELPGWAPGHQVNLGLDLRGGSHLLLRVDYPAVLAERLDAVVDALRTRLRAADIGYTGLGIVGNAVQFEVRDAADADRARAVVADLEDDVTASIEGTTVRVAFTEAAVETVRDNSVNQSIEIVRRRIDELGTAEPTIQRQGADRILVQLPGVDDPERIKDLLGQTARLTFHLLDPDYQVGQVPQRVPVGSQVLPSAELGPGGEPAVYYVVRRRVMVSGDTLVDAQATFQDNRPVVSFRFDSVGARRFGDVTRDNVNRALAIVLDDKVISAPRIESPILGGSGIIRGNFTVREANDLALLLRAGALPAPLTVLEERTVGPGLGQDSIESGQTASIIAFAVVIVFMVIAYGLFGIMASLALVFNLILLLALLSALQATLTLPGIAGIVLTVGMAVDANVLIFERIREEIRNGRSPISAIDAGYSRALSTIVDANVTTLIAAVLLFALGSGPVRGFAVTLALGVLTSMFSAIMITRLMVVTWLRRTRPKTIPI